MRERRIREYDGGRRRSKLMMMKRMLTT